MEQETSLRIFDPIREWDIWAAYWPKRLVVCSLEADSYSPTFMVRACVNFSPQAIWIRYVRAVESRTQRKYREVAGGFNMREWLQNLPE